MGSPQVTIASINGPFGQVFLAEELQKKNSLVALLDSLPWWRAKRKHPWLRKNQYFALPLVEYERYLRHVYLNKFISLAPRSFNEIERTIFSKWAARVVPEADIQIFLAGCALESLKRARSKGIKTILFNNSTHIDHAVEVMNKESDYRGLPRMKHISPWFRERLLEEYELADYVRVPAELPRTTFLERGFSKDKIRTVFHGYEIDIFKPGIKKDNIFRIVFFGRISFRKGVPYLIEAVKRAQLSHCELLFIGGMVDNMQPYLRQLNIPYKLTGHVSWKAAATLLQQCSVSVFLSLEEGSAGTLGQAMACGVPVIASKSSGAEPLIRHGIDGFVVEAPQDVDEVASLLQQLSQNPDQLAEVSRAAAQRATKFTWPRHAECMMGWFQEIQGQNEKL